MEPIERRERAAEEAAEWWVLLQGTLPRADRERYIDWLRESPVHIAEMLRLAQIHRAIDQFQGWSLIPFDGKVEEAANVTRLGTANRPREQAINEAARCSQRRIVTWGRAAVLFAVMALATVLTLQLRGQTIETGRGERREMELADGSVVQVDPETRIRIKYEDHARRVFLDRGRAFFHVAKNAERPFLVETRNTTVRAVGTAFAVERNDDSVVVTVAEGRVAVLPALSMAAQPLVPPPPSGRSEIDRTRSRATAASSPVSPGHEPTQSVLASSHGFQTNAAGSEIYLTSNQQLTVNGSGAAEAPLVVDSGRTLAWASGRVILENTSVADAMREFNRSNRVQIIVRDPELARRPISGVFNAADPESFAAFLASVTRVRVTRMDAEQIVVEAAP